VLKTCEESPLCCKGAWARNTEAEAEFDVDGDAVRKEEDETEAQAQAESGTESGVNELGGTSRAGLRGE
jgi:hypothetical protein